MEDSGGLWTILLASSEHLKRLNTDDHADHYETYLGHLLSRDLRRIACERARLDKEEEAVRDEVRVLVLDRYGTLLDGHGVRQAADEALERGRLGLYDFKTALTTFERELESFVKQVPRLRREGEFRRTTLASGGRHDSAALATAIDLLWAPNLISTCIQTGFASGLAKSPGSTTGVATAIDLIAHIEFLANEAGQEASPETPGLVFLTRQLLPLVLLQRKEIAKRLFANLSAPVLKLPQATRTVDLLRRLYIPRTPTAQAVSDETTVREDDLRTLFILLRRDALRRALQAKEIQRDRKVDPSRYLKKYLDTFREMVYDIVTQHRSIFPLSRSERLVEEEYGLFLFSTSAMNELFTTIRTTLPLLGTTDDMSFDQRHAFARAPTPEISSQVSAMLTIFTQASYCSASFARIGLDFKPILLEMFSERIRVILSKQFDQAVEAFTKSLAAESLAGLQSSRTNSGTMPEVPAADAFVPFEPPLILGQFTSIKVLTNAILTGLNALRQMALRILRKDVAQLLDHSLSRALQLCVPQVKDAYYLVILTDVLVPFARLALYKGVYSIEPEPMLSVLQEAVDVIRQKSRREKAQLQTSDDSAANLLVPESHASQSAADNAVQNEQGSTVMPTHDIAAGDAQRDDRHEVNAQQDVPYSS